MSDAIEVGEDIDEIIERFDDLVFEAKMEEARTFIERAIEVHPNAPMLRASKAELEIEEDNFEGGIAILDEVIAQTDDPFELSTLLVFKAYATYYLDELDEARQLFNEALRYDTEMWSGLIGRATVHESMGFMVAALLDLEHAIAIDDQEAEPFALRAKIHLKRNQIEDAKRDFEYTLESNPYDEEARLNLARIEAREGNNAYAIELLELLIEEGREEDTVAAGALLRSQLSMTLGSTEAAAEDAERTIELWPDKPWGHLQLAACLLSSGRPEETLKALKEAESRVSNVRDIPDIFALRANAYEQMEKEDKARREHNKVEGMPRLPAIVYGPQLNPAQNVPINPNRPIDIRAILGNLFGNPDRAPKGYEDELRKIIDRIPEIVEQNPNVERIQIELPEVEGMTSASRNLIIQVNNPNKAPQQQTDPTS